MVKKKKKVQNVSNWQIIAGGILILLVLQVGIQAIKARQDVNTRKAAMSAGEKVEAHIDKTKAIPQTIANLNYSLPKTVRYEKINDKTFQFCEVFHRNNDPSKSKLEMFANLVFNRSTANMKWHQIDGKYGTMVVDDLHTSGLHCQTVYYYTLNQK
jgi:hypothetical protein